MHLINKMFEGKTIRTVWDKDEEKYFVSVIDIVEALTDSVDPAGYWRKLKQRLKQEGNEITLERLNENAKAMHGTMNDLINNMITGVTNGYAKTLEIIGVGYRFNVQGKKLVISAGYSHPVEMEDPEGIESKVDGNKIIVSGIDKEKVGQYAAEIREKRAPEPYKGKGIKYADEVIRRKVGKTGKK